MNKKRFKAAITPLTTTILLLAMFLSSISPVSALEIPRNQILWGSGYYPHPVNFRPYLIDSGEGWDTYIMYEPMFGTNVATGELIKWLGQDISWLNSTAIQVTLRQSIKWSDGTPITSYDVRYSYLLLGAFSESPSWAYYMGGVRTRVGSMSNFEIVDNRTFKVHINLAYANSSVVWRQMTQSFVIMPEKVWADVNRTEVAAGKILQDFANDWQDPATPAKWKVASGMYLPYWHDDVRTIMKRDENWWGISVFGKEPAPPYLGYITYDTNPPAALALQAGELDWCGKYIPGINIMAAADPYIHTYFSDPPYFPDKSALLLVPNHRKYPLNEPWLHKAITAVMDYDSFSTVCSGYLKEPNVLLLPADDVVARQLLNTTILAEYSIPYNVTYALALLNQYCIKGSDGRWYTKEGPSQDYLETYGQTIANYTDALPNTPGMNIPLGPWTLIDISGWTDVNAVDVFAADAVSSLLGISLSTQFIDFGTYTSKMDANNYDFADYCMHWGINGDLYQRYTQLFTGAYEGAWNHYGSYRNATLNTLLDALDTALSGSQAQQNIANQIEEIVGQDLPIIPEGGHPDWYIYYDKYWVGWPNENSPFLPASPFGGSTQDANLHAVLLGLKTHVLVEFSSLRVSKANVLPGETTAILVNVKNTETIGGVNTIKLSINGIVVETREVTFVASETKTLSFSASRQQIGTYSATIGGYSGTTAFTVAEALAIPAYIKGNITDANTENPISNATIIAGAHTTTTATNGSYSLPVANGTYIVTVVMNGYKTGNATVNALVQGTTYTANIALTPLPSAEVPMWVYGVIAVLVIIAVVALAYALVFKKKK